MGQVRSKKNIITLSNIQKSKTINGIKYTALDVAGAEKSSLAQKGKYRSGQKTCEKITIFVHKKKEPLSDRSQLQRRLLASFRALDELELQNWAKECR